MSFFTFWPNEKALVRAGYADVAHVPCIFSTDGSYSDDPSRYLRERALAEWTPGVASFRDLISAVYPTKKTLKTYADVLTNFLEWTEIRHLDWRNLRYTEDIVNGYQHDMERGAWSATGRALKPATINLRVGESCNYLRWAGEKGLRDAFSIVSSPTPVTAYGGTSPYGLVVRVVDTRAGRARAHPAMFDIPDDATVRRWFASVTIRRGFTKSLICELILKAGIRREEAVEWRIDTLPLDETTWEIKGDRVIVTVKYGAKGRKTKDEYGDEVGPPRQVGISLELARLLQNYRKLRRPRARAQYARRAPNKEETYRRMHEQERRLFISEFTGERISAQTLYEAWTSGVLLPFAGWSPHFGRHYWACKRLIALLRADAKRAGVGEGQPIPQSILANASSYIELFIQPQLGHISKSTTQEYLVWIKRMFSLDALQENYSDELDRIVATSEYGNLNG